MPADPRQEMGRCSGGRVHLLGRHLPMRNNYPADQDGLVACDHSFLSLLAFACLTQAGGRTTRRAGVDKRPMADGPTTPPARRMLDRHSAPATRVPRWLTPLEQRTLSYSRNH